MSDTNFLHILISLSEQLPTCSIGISQIVSYFKSAIGTRSSPSSAARIQLIAGRGRGTSRTQGRRNCSVFNRALVRRDAREVRTL